jgi:hypothetical protein
MPMGNYGKVNNGKNSSLLPLILLIASAAAIVAIVTFYSTGYAFSFSFYR